MHSNNQNFLNGEVMFATAPAATLFDYPAAMPFEIKSSKKLINIVPWGGTNNMPLDIIDKVDRSPDLAAAIQVNIQMLYGSGITPCRIQYNNDGTRRTIPATDNKEIIEFFEINDLQHYLLEQASDLVTFGNAFPEIITDRRPPASRRIVRINHKEAVFSRWSTVDETTGEIGYHVYSSHWNTGIIHSDEGAAYEVTPVLNGRHPLKDLQQRTGRIPTANGTSKDSRQYRFIINNSMPSPGRTYYQRPAWYSIIESGWLDFALMIPQFKKNLLTNSMNLKYIIYLSDDYFPDIFAREGITSDEDKAARIRIEYENFNKYLSGVKNSGKSIVSFTKTSPDGKKEYRVEIMKMANDIDGGEYLKDSSDVSTLIAYSLGIHPSIIGVTPGSGNNRLSATEKREVFQIRQALMKPIRDRLLKPLYLIKAYNRWPKDIEFVINDLDLVTME